ncbi:hypothetical protein ABBQ32_008770 [Trebouxia sp. C0010 RCD-2024]
MDNSKPIMLCPTHIRYQFDHPTVANGRYWSRMRYNHRKAHKLQTRLFFAWLNMYSKAYILTPMHMTGSVLANIAQAVLKEKETQAAVDMATNTNCWHDSRQPSQQSTSCGSWG